jgi:hypothetical protein
MVPSPSGRELDEGALGVDRLHYAHTPTKLAVGFDAVRRRKAKPVAVVPPGAGGRGVTTAPSDDGAGGQREFAIPLARGRSAKLVLPVPIAENDLPRLKGWFDLMSDILVAQPG